MSPVPVFTPVPPTVSDQVLLWERELDRLQKRSGVLLQGFAHDADYAAVKEHAQAAEAVVWCEDERRLLIVDPAQKKEIKQFWAAYQAGRQQDVAQTKVKIERDLVPSFDDM